MRVRHACGYWTIGFKEEQEDTKFQISVQKMSAIRVLYLGNFQAMEDDGT
ncbi:uncharacterized protein G2W53_034175 [Senna tora]|uniref:Uncharacterized protein n=1 Tax=Senna tora TaxID=362788 RepID=A0A834WDI2_9FABA|nr:uncharacterized protein G2W53_034175 [Senna tora]